MIPVRFGKLDIELLDFAIHLSEVLENVWFPIVLIFEWLVLFLVSTKNEGIIFIINDIFSIVKWIFFLYQNCLSAAYIIATKICERRRFL